MLPTDKPIKIQIDPDGQEKNFKSYSELVAWLQGEQKAWNWLVADHSPYQVKAIAHFGQVGGYRNKIDGTQTVEDADNRLNRLEEYLNNTHGGGEILVSEAAEGSFIQNLKDTDIVVASGAINFFKNLEIPKRQNPYNNTHEFKTDVGRQIKGYILASNFKAGRLTEEQLKKRLDSLVSGTNKSAKSLFETLNGDLESSRGAYEKHDADLTTLHGNFSSIIAEAEKKAQETVKHLQDRTTEIEKIYKEQVQLQAPTQYFNAQGILHSKEASKYFKVFTGVTIAFLVCFCVLVYLVFGKIDSIKDVEKYLILAAFFTFGTWFIRTYYRVYINHQHLKTVSGEKEVLVKVYLSLLKSDTGLGKEDRALILAPLFKVPQNVFSKGDSGPGSPVEVLLRNIQN